MKYGYARVSTDDQKADMQRAALTKAGCAKIFTDDGKSGATTNRPALRRCLETLDRGDSLTVWKLDRLGRSLRDLITILDDLKQRKTGIHALVQFVRTIKRDLAAVGSGGRTAWSNGPIEGQINRLKTLKRQMYGQAGLELLRAGLLPLAALGLHQNLLDRGIGCLFVDISLCCHGLKQLPAIQDGTVICIY